MSATNSLFKRDDEVYRDLVRLMKKCIDYNSPYYIVGEDKIINDSTTTTLELNLIKNTIFLSAKVVDNLIEDYRYLCYSTNSINIRHLFSYYNRGGRYDSKGFKAAVYEKFLSCALFSGTVGRWDKLNVSFFEDRDPIKYNCSEPIVVFPQKVYYQMFLDAIIEAIGEE